MSNLEKELEKQLKETGSLLLSLPSSVTDLLALLDRVENLLIRVDQSPSESMKKSLSTAMEALVGNGLLRHPNVDVKVAVASCISEITRITAPDAPYEDDQMKDVFQLIVSSFEKLDDKSSLSYVKRTSILETVAKVRSCVVMLDLECDALILEMFQHFFKSIRDDHPENVFSSMETIMTLVLEESEDISLALLTSILDFLKSDNEEALPIARHLAEKVIEKCASKVKPYLLPAIKSRGASIDDYNKVVATVCGAGSEVIEPTDKDCTSKQMGAESEVANVPPAEKAVEVANESVDDVPTNEEVVPTTVGSPNSPMRNGTLQKDVEGTTTCNASSNEADQDTQDQDKKRAEPSKGNAESREGPAKSESKPEKSSKRKGKKASVLKSPSEPSEASLACDKEEVVKMPEHQPKGSTEVDSANIVDSVADVAESAENAKESGAPASSPKTSENKQEKSNKRKGRKASVLKSPSVPSEASLAHDKEEVAKVSEHQIKDSTEVDSANIVDSVADVGESAENAKESGAPASSPKTTEKKQGKSKKRKGGKSRVLKSPSDPSEASLAHDKEEVAKVSEHQTKDSTEVDSAKLVDSVADVAESAENEKESGAPVSDPKASESEPADAPSVSPNEKPTVGSKKVVGGKKKGDSDAKKASEGAGISEAKSHKRSGKKASSALDNEDKIACSANVSNKEADGTSEGKKKKKGLVKATSAKDAAKTPSKEVGKKPLSKSAEKSAKVESDVEKASKTSSKRKRSAEKENASETKGYGAELVGARVKVLWPDDDAFYAGRVESFDDVKREHTVNYDDGDVEVLNLENEKWHLIDDEKTAADQERSSEGEGPAESDDMPIGKKVKKAKANVDSGSKGKKTGSSAKKGSNSADKSKATPKSGFKQKDIIKIDGKSKEESSKGAGKSDDSKGGKSKDAKTGNKSSNDTPKSVGKSKKDNAHTPKSGNKSKQGTVKGSAKSKAKSPLKTGKTKAGSTSKDEEEKQEDVEMSPEPVIQHKVPKGKTPSTSKSQKSGKRKRGGKKN